MSVKVYNICKSFGSQKALNDVTFEVSEGEVVGFLGPNGAGKSTLMKIATGLMQADSGRVEVCGIDVSREPRKAHRLIGYLPEQNPLYTDMFVREYLTMVADSYGLADVENRVEEMIELTGLTPEAHKQIGSLSKGYRQRVGLAQALIHKPQVVILDEPTTGLDPNQLVEIRQLIRSVGKQCTVLLSTHIMQEVEAMCDRVVIIDHGEIRAEGKANDIASSLKGVRHIEVEFDQRVSASALSIEFEQCEVEQTGDCSCLFKYSGEGDVRPEIFRYAVKNNLVLLQMTSTDNSLEQIFRSVTN